MFLVQNVLMYCFWIMFMPSNSLAKIPGVKIKVEMSWTFEAVQFVAQS